MSDAGAVVRRFYETLVGEIRTSRPQYLRDSFTVAEIYQTLVPYSSHRDRIGVEMNGDYEDALLRLLAGEGDYLLLGSDAASRELRAELELSHPNTAVVRDFAAVEVRLNPDSLEGPLAATAELGLDFSGGGNDVSDVYGGADEAYQAGEPDVPEAPAPPAPPVAAPAEAADSSGSSSPSGPPASAAATAACPWCLERLPERESVKFCPFCGGDASAVPCGRCGEALEAGWRYCIACGTEVGS